MLKIKHKDKKTDARIGELKTKSGIIETPFFMPVGTKASVKLMMPEELHRSGTKAIISNSLVLSLYPGIETIKKFGGIHKFMNFNGVIFTDSGGFQVIREGFEPKIDNHGLHYKNPYNGSKEILTPAKAMHIQNMLNSDVIMCLDDMLLPGADHERVALGVKRTYEWGKICKQNHKNKRQLLFGITQGGVSKKLRKESIKLMTSIGFDGYSIGGLAIGESKENMFKVIELSCGLLPEDKPRYVMGLGSPQDILQAISHGVDCFDSVYPTRIARRNSLLTRKGPIKILRSIYKDDMGPIEKGCDCYTCRNYTKAYLHHLARSKELSAMMLNSIHNVAFLQQIVAEAKMHIKDGKFAKFEKEFLKGYKINSE